MWKVTSQTPQIPWPSTISQCKYWFAWTTHLPRCPRFTLSLLRSLLDEQNSALLAFPLLGNQLTCENLLTTMLKHIFFFCCFLLLFLNSVANQFVKISLLKYKTSEVFPVSQRLCSRGEEIWGHRGGRKGFSTLPGCHLPFFGLTLLVPKRGWSSLCVSGMLCCCVCPLNASLCFLSAALVGRQ